MRCPPTRSGSCTPPRFSARCSGRTRSRCSSAPTTSTPRSAPSRARSSCVASAARPSPARPSTRSCTRSYAMRPTPRSHGPSGHDSIGSPPSGSNRSSRAARTTAPRCSRTISCRRSSSDGPPASTSRIFSHEQSTLSDVRASGRGGWRHHGRPRASTGVRSTSWATRSPTRSCSSTSAGRWRSRVRPPTGSRPSSAPTGDCSRGMTPKARPLRSCSSTRRAGSPARVSTWRCWNRRRLWSRTPPTAFRGFAS